MTVNVLNGTSVLEMGCTVAGLGSSIALISLYTYYKTPTSASLHVFSAQISRHGRLRRGEGAVGTLYTSDFTKLSFYRKRNQFEFFCP